MPNHVYSNLEISGTSKDVYTLLKQAKGLNHHGEESLFSCHSFIPMPQSIINDKPTPEEAKEYDTKQCWYKWSIKNWGSKWGMYDIIIEDTLPNFAHFINDIKKVKIHINFQTAWSPVLPVIMKVSELYPKVKIIYTFIDEGGGFGAIVEYLNGKTKIKKQDDGNGNNLKPIKQRLRRLGAI